LIDARMLANGAKIVSINVLLLALLLGVAELVTRAFFPTYIGTIGHTGALNSNLYGWGFSPGDKIRIGDPDTGHTYHTTANNHGWRDVDHSFDNPAKSYRILVLGDSVTFGVIVPLEHTYPRILERLLRSRGLNVEVISIAYGGWGTDQELEALINEGLKYKPQLVIVQFCANDLSDNTYFKNPNLLGQKPFHYALEDGKLVRRDNPHFVFKKSEVRPRARRDGEDGLAKSIALRSELFKHFYKAYANRRLRDQPIAVGKAPAATELWVSKNQLRMLELNLKLDKSGPLYTFLTKNIEKPISNDEFLPLLASSEVANQSPAVLRILEKRWFQEYWSEGRYRVPASNGGSYEWQLYFALIRQMQVLAEKAGARLAVVPETEEGHRLWEVAWYRTDPSEENKVNYLSHLRVLEKGLGDLGVDFIRNTRVYQRARNDPHPNKEGNLAIAEDLADYVMRVERGEPGKGAGRIR
jgi:hypothetical protein